ncbi:helix-turn-helix transcriptional regulator [uncultured Maricaulis sp.]|uniref:helix-turn-helix transcriptional regulator n=1 Tax=uncultured Maricaulis sp. TaxID=174710 RepID=UPI0030DDA59C|tara:strand:- start:151480 stop:151923 length:444 start_codon:yes stop_codon:yes gene_type:complete
MSALIGSRLREERIRLGASQCAFAGLIGASKRALVEWEKGKTSPKALHLARWSESGLDALYVVTGRRERVEMKAAPIKVRLHVDEQKLAALGSDFIAQFEAKLNGDDFITIERQGPEVASTARPAPGPDLRPSLLSFLGLGRKRREG